SLEAFPARFKPGMTATIDVETIREENALAVPLQAVTMRDFSLVHADTTASLDEDMRRVVFLVDDGKAKMVEVETGISDDRFIHIVSGLENEQEIVSGNYRVLSRDLNDGDRIMVMNRSRGTGRVAQ
ncbi:efflux RND transporter periplasmic adaptor subunit, partial [Balneolaceae bacterium ANBcel3]|nr:efflux RND transporter periplasmic adaptor subunit [Balneolaceae bacterium ANBcel3]